MAGAVDVTRLAKTEWFPPHIKPVWIGWYPRRLSIRTDTMADSHQYMNYWDGLCWHYNGHPDWLDSGVAAETPGPVCLGDNWAWRGLCKKHPLTDY